MKTAYLIVLLGLLSLSAAGIEISGKFDSEIFPIRIYCLGGLEQEHILYWCKEGFDGTNISPEMCKPSTSSIPPFEVGQRPVCPIDGSVPYVRHKWHTEDIGLNYDMEVLTNKGWMPQRQRTRRS